MASDTPRTDHLRAGPLRKVAVVGGGPDILDWLETVLDAGDYQLCFLDDLGGAYAGVRELQPDVVVLCARIEEAAAFQCLTMLKLDPDTRAIPVRTYTTEWEGQFTSGNPDDWWDEDIVHPRPHRCLPLN